MTDTSPAHTRRLFYVPVLHSTAELGGVADDVRRHVGDDVFARRQAFVEGLWDRVEAWAATLPRALAGFKLYQDGLPACGRERLIVDDLAAAGSRNHRLLAAMTDRGAELVGAESGELLIQEYAMARAALQPGADRAALLPQAAELLAARDAFIARRINDTLGPGETGVLFIGMLHNVHRNLAPDIDLVVPFTTETSNDKKA